LGTREQQDRLPLSKVLTEKHGFYSVSDPDTHGSALILVGWIWIRIQEGKMILKNRKREESLSFEVLEILF
jgi:hypothetical protein